MGDTQQVARRYFDAWTSGDSDTVAALLSPTFRFTAGDLSIDGREAFLDSGAFPDMAAFAAFVGAGGPAEAEDHR